MLLRITDIHSTSQYCIGCRPTLKRSLLCNPVNSPCHTANDGDSHPGYHTAEFPSLFLSVIRMFSGSHNRNCQFLFPRQSSFHKKPHRCIRSFKQTLRISFIEKTIIANSLFLKFIKLRLRIFFLTSIQKQLTLRSFQHFFQFILRSMVNSLHITKIIH